MKQRHGYGDAIWLHGSRFNPLNTNNQQQLDIQSMISWPQHCLEIDADVTTHLGKVVVLTSVFCSMAKCSGSINAINDNAEFSNPNKKMDAVTPNKNIFRPNSCPSYFMVFRL